MKDVSCTMAYHGLCVNQDGTLDPCCQYKRPLDHQPLMFHETEAFRSNTRAAMDRDFQQGIRHAGCDKCYREEDLGWTTLRQHSLNWYGRDSNLSPQTPVWDLELRFGNICNLKCMMCHPSASSAVAAERHQHNDRFTTINLAVPTLANMPSWWEHEQFESWTESMLPNVQRINITGGEPFLIPQVIDILRLIADRSPHTAISFNTNLTRIPDGLIGCLQRLEEITVIISLEGVGVMNDYIRYPSHWQIINANIYKLKRMVPHARLGVNHTLQHGSAYSLPDLISYCAGLDLDLQMTMVQGMPWLEMSSVPPMDLADFRNRLDGDCLDHERRRFLYNLIDTTEFDRNRYNQFRNYVAILDNIRGTSWDQTFQPTMVD